MKILMYVVLGRFDVFSQKLSTCWCEKAAEKFLNCQEINE